jgi:hypothetical protein
VLVECEMMILAGYNNTEMRSFIEIPSTRRTVHQHFVHTQSTQPVYSSRMDVLRTQAFSKIRPGQVTDAMVRWGRPGDNRARQSRNQIRSRHLSICFDKFQHPSNSNCLSQPRALVGELIRIVLKYTSDN